MNDVLKNEIQEQAKKIRDDMVNARLYGEPIDMADPDAVLWAAYLMGEQRERQFWMDQREFAKSMGWPP